MENYGTGNKVQIFGAEIRSTREPNSRLLGVNISVTIAKIGITTEQNRFYLPNELTNNKEKQKI